MASAAVVGELERSQELLGRVLTSGGVAADGLALVDEAMSKVAGAIASLQGHAAKTKKKRKKECCAEMERHEAKRRRSMTGTLIMSHSLDDGYAWRKYGQKEIQNAKNSRCYFRCTYKYDRGCQATRQAQRSNDDPSIYHITYFGQHTCMESFMSRRSNSSSNNNNNNNLLSRKPPCMIDFGSSKQAQDQCLSLPRPSTALLKQEQDIIPGVSFSQECLSSDHAPEQASAYLEASGGLTQASDVVVSEHGDVTSTFHSPMGLEVDFMDDAFLANMFNLGKDTYGFLDI